MTNRQKCFQSVGSFQRFLLIPHKKVLFCVRGILEKEFYWKRKCNYVVLSFDSFVIF